MRKRLPKYSSEKQDKDTNDGYPRTTQRKHTHAGPYSTARDEYQGELGIYLDANENPYDNNYNRYPDPHQKNLKRRLAEIKGVPVEKIFIGNGSDEPIDLVFRLFCEPRRHNAVSIAPTYGMYKVAAAINDVQMREVQLEPGFTLDAEKLLAAADENTRLLFLCSPNNPSGNCFPKKEIEKVIRRFNGIVILDEAYIDFAGQPGFLSELDEYPNLVILQTLSKAWGMAGLRLGLAFAQPLIVDTLSRVKYPYNINVVTQKSSSNSCEDPPTRRSPKSFRNADACWKDSRKTPSSGKSTRRTPTSYWSKWTNRAQYTTA